MLNLRAMLAASGISVPDAGGVNWSDYDATGDKAEVEFSSDSSRYVSVTKIDDTRGLICYRGASSNGKAQIASIDGSGNVSLGTEFTVISSNIGDIDAALLDSTHAVIAVEDGGVVKVGVIEFSGTTISSVGTFVNTETVDGLWIRITAFSSSAFLVAYHDGTGVTGRCYYGTVSGTTVTMGNGVTYVSSYDIDDLSVAALTSTAAVILSCGDETNDLQADLITISGSTPSVTDTLAIVTGGNIEPCDIIKIDDNNLLAAWGDNSGNTGDCCIITESSGSLSSGTVQEFSSDELEDIRSSSKGLALSLMDSTHAMATISNNANNAVKSTVIEISGTTVTPLTQYTNISGDREFIGAASIGDWVLIGYENDNDGSDGYVKVLGV